MRIGIIGGSGYVGSELLRLLLMHPAGRGNDGYFTPKSQENTSSTFTQTSEA